MLNARTGLAGDRIDNLPETISGSTGTNLGDFAAAMKEVADYYGRPSSSDVMFSGIPLPDAGIGREDIERVADRLGLSVEVNDRKSVKSGRMEFPAILVFEGDGFAYCEDATSAQQLLSITRQKKSDRRRLRGAYSFSLIYENKDERRELGGAAPIERSHWLFGPMRQHWGGYLSVVVAAVFINLLALASPIFIMNVYDRILPNKATSSLIALAVGVGVALLFDLLLKNARSAIIDASGRAVDRKVSYGIFDKVLNTRLSERPASTGEYANRVSQMEFVREFFTSNTLATLIDTIFVFVFVFVVYLLAGWLFVIPLGALVFAILIGLVAQYRIGRRVARAANETAQRQSLLVESISTIETIKSLRAEAPILRRWSELTKNATRTSEEIKRLSASAANLTQFVQQFVSVLIVVAGSYEFARGNMTTGAIIATVILSGRTVAPLSQVSMTLARLRQAILSLRILNQIMKQEEDRPASVGFVSRPVTDGRFSFENVTFSYPESDAKALQDLSFTVKSGERVGIIGRIGSGKTTIGRLLNGLYHAQEGRVLINGIDVRQYHPAEVRSAVAYAGQSVDLFTGTLKENLRLAKANASDEEIIEAAKMTGVDSFAAAHPRGYDLAVGEHGSNLSGGQKQSVAITRLLLASPKIVFLDEPSGALDMATERELIGNLADAFGRNVTLIISTHRYSLLELVDRLIVLDRGRISADGPKDKVLAELKARARSVAAKRRAEEASQPEQSNRET